MRPARDKLPVMAASIRPGDHVPVISLPDAAGEPFDLMQPALAVSHRVLALGPPPSAPALRAAGKVTAARNARLVLVLPREPSPAPVPGAGDAPVLFDPNGQLAAHLGLPAAGGAAVLTPRGRLGFLGIGAGALDAALATLPEPAPPVIRRPGAPVLMIPAVLEPELRAALRAHWDRGEKLRDRVASEAGAANAARVKRRADVPLDDRDLYATFHERLARRVVPEMARAFRFRPASFEAPRVGCYDGAERGAFGAHRDNRTPFTRHRRFAMSLNLNTGEYEGGRLCFPEFGPDLYEPEAGGCAIFSCDLLHEAQPVTRGRRFAVFTFFTDAEGAAQEQELIRQRMAAGEAGVQVR